MSAPVSRRVRPCLTGWLLRWFGRGVSVLPIQVQPKLGAVLARMPWLGRRRRIAACNLSLCFPQLDRAARASLLRATLAANATGALDTLRAWFAPSSRLRDAATIEGLQHLQAALRAGDGVVVVGAHYDSIELAIRLVAEASGRRMPILVRRYNEPCLERVVDAGRLRYAGATYDKKDVAGFCAEARRGGGVFYVPDQNANRRTAFVPFFGVPAATLDAIPGVLGRAGGVVLLMWSRRGADGRLAIDLQPAPAGFSQGDGADVAARYMAWIESRVAAAPEQYLWIHRRFRTRPAGEPDVYV